MVRAGEIEHGAAIADRAETVWNWSSCAGRRRAGRRASLILDAAELDEDSHALELGCGTGVFTEPFARCGCRLTAIDVCPDLLERAEAKSLGPRVSFQKADAENLPFDDESFDAVIGSSVLHHLDTGSALREAWRVLKPGGRLAFAEPNMLNPQIALQRTIPFLRRWAGESPEETAFVRWRFARELSRAGFTDLRVEPFDFLHPAVPRGWIGVVERVGGVLERLPALREIAGSLLIRGRRGFADLSADDRGTTEFAATCFGNWT